MGVDRVDVDLNIRACGGTVTNRGVRETLGGTLLASYPLAHADLIALRAAATDATTFGTAAAAISAIGWTSKSADLQSSWLAAFAEWLCP